ncbi:MAG: hypothetical protein GY861_21475 [bacterium]|nr:hypothetical protein [bacterium]
MWLRTFLFFIYGAGKGTYRTASRSFRSNRKTISRHRAFVTKRNSKERELIKKDHGHVLRDYSAPLCDICHVPMIRRDGKHGTFWGCALYPRCRFTRPYIRTRYAIG